MGWITSILTVLGIGQAALPIIEKMLSGLGQYTAMLVSQLFGAGAAQKLDDILAEAEGFVNTVEADLPGAITEVKNLATDLDGLFALWPGLAPQLVAEYNVMKGQNVPRKIATRVVIAAHSNAKVKAG